MSWKSGPMVYFGRTIVFCVYFLLLSSFAAQSAEVEVNSQVIDEEFYVNPGGLGKFEKTLGNSFTCFFSYIAQGGTNEKWILKMTANPITCTIERPEGKSYLFFQEFMFSITKEASAERTKLSHAIHIEEVEVFGDSGQPLRPEEFKVDHVKNQVRHVEGMFRSQLSKITVVAKSRKGKRKSEL